VTPPVRQASLLSRLNGDLEVGAKGSPIEIRIVTAPMTAHCHTHSCACASMSDSMELRNASDKSKGSPSSAASVDFNLVRADAFRYENVPAALSIINAGLTSLDRFAKWRGEGPPERTRSLVSRRLNWCGPPQGPTVNRETPG